MTEIPITSETTTVRVSITGVVVGRSIPTALNTAWIPFAKATPPARPASDPTSPISAASAITEPRIWPLEAPRVRSIANSRTRWATVIEKVLKIRNAPTNSATPAKTSRAICRKLRLSRISLD